MGRFRGKMSCLIVAATFGCAGLLMSFWFNSNQARPMTGIQVLTFKGPDGQTAKYSLFVPKSYDGATPVPVMMFLHGSAQAGTDGKQPTNVGLGPAIRARADSFPFLVIFPQVSDRVPATHGSWLPGQPDADRALAILDDVHRQFRTDRSRVYLTGNSVGGTGVWNLAAEYPDRWAAIVPICGIGPVSKAESLKSMPCWCFHGADDGIVPVERSRNMIDAIRAVGGQPRYTEYPKVGHNSWDPAYENDELYAWLLSQVLNQPAVRSEWHDPSKSR